MHSNQNTTEADSKSSKDFDYRRKRVNRIKTIIVILIITFLMLPTIFCIFLGIQVSRLQKQVKELVELHSQYGLTYEETEGSAYAYAAESNTKDRNPNNTNDIKMVPADDSITQSGQTPTNDDTVISNEATDGNTNTQSNQNFTGKTNIQKSNASKTKTDKTNTDKTDKIADNVNSQSKLNSSDIEVQQISSSQETVSDAAGAVTENINSEDNVTKGIYSDKKVYLTFDDGPSIYTDEILDILAEYNVKATFFVIGKTDQKSKKMYQRIVKEGHTLGMHSYSHQYGKIYNSVEDFDKDFTKLWKLLYDTTGYQPSIFRFPGGSDNLVNKNGMNEFIQYLNDKSIVYYDWNVVNGDATGIIYTKNQLIHNVLSGLDKKTNCIVLMHDSQTKEATVKSLPGLLKKLIAGDAQILPLDNDVPPIQMIKADSVQ